MLSAAAQTLDTDWNLFAKAMMSLQEVKRKSISDIAAMEVVNHHNDRELKIFWEKVYNATK